MPCIKCSNGKYKYGEHGDCQFDTLAKCETAAAAIHINNPSAKETAMDTKKPKKKPVGPNGLNIVEPGPHGPIMEGKDMGPIQPALPINPFHDPTCQCTSCKSMYPTYPMK
jgi:hypothetical protein